jgi:ring-1,2-phenylacetyl-CoA epoxidase subunit PaaE
VAVKLLPDGIFSRFVSDQLAVGDPVAVMTPAGRFGPRPLHDDLPRTYVAVVAGSGITPVMSIITTVLESQPNAAVVLLYGNRSAGSVMFAEGIADLKDRFLTRLQVFHALSQEDHGSPRLGGRIDRTTLALHPPESVHECSCAGPPGWSTWPATFWRTTGCLGGKFTPSCSGSALQCQRRAQRRALVGTP